MTEEKITSEVSARCSSRESSEEPGSGDRERPLGLQNEKDPLRHLALEGVGTFPCEFHDMSVRHGQLLEISISLVRFRLDREGAGVRGEVRLQSRGHHVDWAGDRCGSGERS